MTVQDLKTEWKQVRKDAKARWGKLTKQDLKEIGGDPDRLISRLEQRYHFPRQIVLAEVSHFLAHTR